VNPYRVRLTKEADHDLEELHESPVVRNLQAAARAGEALHAALDVLKRFPYACRKSETVNDPSLRELLVPFGGGGYVVLFRIALETVTIIAARHQREDDYR
jgi:plasmid stabilization system protein ParE